MNCFVHQNLSDALRIDLTGLKLHDTSLSKMIEPPESSVALEH